MTMRTVTNIGTMALLLQTLLVQGCGSNNPSTTDTGGTTGAAGNAMPTAGTTAAAGATATTPAGGTTAAAGATATTPAGGTTAAAGATATTPAGGISAAAGAIASTPTGGTSGAAGASGTASFTPLCAALTTAAGSAPTKSGVCTATDPQLCYKTCGPKSIGFKSETCTAGTYAEQSGCSFPPGDYSCYKIPTAIDPSCPATVPQASQPCSVADCVLCNVGGNYLDSTGASKAGYCVCPVTTAGTPGKWSCASTTAWPCPGGQGC
jgi:hypothetical protein